MTCFGWSKCGVLIVEVLLLFILNHFEFFVQKFCGADTWRKLSFVL